MLEYQRVQSPMKFQAQKVKMMGLNKNISYDYKSFSELMAVDGGFVFTCFVGRVNAICHLLH